MGVERARIKFKFRRIGFLRKYQKMSIQKLGTGGVCGKNDAKYRCPKCETVSCSLACSKVHKKLKNSCDGIRDKTKFVPIKNFSSMELICLCWKMLLATVLKSPNR